MWRIKPGKVFLLRWSSSNLNQLIKGINETCRLYGTDFEELQEKQERFWDTVQKILTWLAAIR